MWAPEISTKLFNFKTTFCISEHWTIILDFRQVRISVVRISDLCFIINEWPIPIWLGKERINTKVCPPLASLRFSQKSLKTDCAHARLWEALAMQCKLFRKIASNLYFKTSRLKLGKNPLKCKVLTIILLRYHLIPEKYLNLEIYSKALGWQCISWASALFFLEGETLNLYF